MRSLRVWALVPMIVAAAACVPRSAAPPEPEPQPARPSAVPTPPPAAVQWQDMPLSPGDWSYSGQGAGSSAAFGAPGQPSFVVRCEPSRQISLARLGASASNVMTVRTSYGDRNVAAVPRQGALVATVAASDRLLDAMVFSRGRFAIEAQGLPMLIVPAWPEVARVVEDCRA